ncbi:hypothetical protein [Azospirillum argentinense]
MLTNKITYPGTWLSLDRYDKFKLFSYMQYTEEEITNAISSYCCFHIEQEATDKRLQEMLNIGGFRTEFQIIDNNLLFRMPFIMARSFVTSLHLSRRMIEYIASNAVYKEDASSAILRFDQAYPALKHVRDSIQHHDERTQGKGRKIKERPNIIAVDNLVGSNYMTMLTDGSQGGISVNLDIINHLIDMYQEVINSFNWHGPPRQWPY